MMADPRREYAMRMGRVLSKTWKDEEFKKRLLSDPVAVLKENRILIPKVGDIKVLEATRNIHYLIIPPESPLDGTDEEHASDAMKWDSRGWWKL